MPAKRGYEAPLSEQVNSDEEVEDPKKGRPGRELFWENTQADGI